MIVSYSLAKLDTHVLRILEHEAEENFDRAPELYGALSASVTAELRRRANGDTAAVCLVLPPMNQKDARAAAREAFTIRTIFQGMPDAPNIPAAFRARLRGVSLAGVQLADALLDAIASMTRGQATA